MGTSATAPSYLCTPFASPISGRERGERGGVERERESETVREEERKSEEETGREGEIYI